MIYRLILVLFCLASTSLVAQPNNKQLAELFAQKRNYQDVQISPNGKYISAISYRDSKKELLVFERETMDLLSSLRFSNTGQVGDYFWGSDEYLVATKEYLTQHKDHPSYYGEVYATKYNGKGRKHLIGGLDVDGWAYLLDPLPHDNEHVLVSVTHYNGSGGADGAARVYKVNLKRGRYYRQTLSPVRNPRFITDDIGQVRFVTGIDDNYDNQSYYRMSDDDDWKKFEFDYDLYPFAFGDKPSQIIASYSVDGKPDKLYEIDLLTAKSKLIAEDDRVDIAKVWISQNTKKVYAVEFERDYPSYVLPYKEDLQAQRLKQLLTTLKGYQVRLSSQTKDGKLQVIEAFNDISPGAYLLYNSETQGLKHLVTNHEKITKLPLAKMHPFGFTTKDGVNLHGYFTMPKTQDNTPAPMVVMPHGGPRSRDYWQYNNEVQMLAQKGIAVMQVNFRGSYGYGEEFMHKGNRQWGNKVQQDIIEATEFVISQGVVDKDRICIMGGSFGAYSALQSSILAPHLYKCAVANAGIYDLAMVHDRGDITEFGSGEEYLIEALGENEQELESYSPVNHVAKLKAELFLAHGGKDRRTPEEQVESLIKQLDKHDKSYEFYYQDDEGHGFYKIEHRAKYYEQVLNFLDKHLAL